MTSLPPLTSPPLTSIDQKKKRLIEILASYGRVAVAFSAGVDSTVVAKAAQIACQHNAVAVTAVSLSLAMGEKEEAEQIARQIGIRHLLVQTQEFSDPQYTQNPHNRCYFCKSELYTRRSVLTFWSTEPIWMIEATTALACKPQRNSRFAHP